MTNYTLEDILKLEKLYRNQLINSISGYKSANLIVSCSNEKIVNVAIFSSVTHFGSNPPILGFVVRPNSVPRDTFENILETKEYTINHISEEMIKDAHQTSARYDKNESEFDYTGLEKELKKNIEIPFVKNSPIQIHLKLLNHYKIKENDTILVLGMIQNIFLNNILLEKDGFVNLSKADIMAVNGLDGYAKPMLIERFSYAKRNIK